MFIETAETEVLDLTTSTSIADINWDDIKEVSVGGAISENDEINAIFSLQPTEEEKDVLYYLFDEWKDDIQGHDDDRLTITEFKNLMEEYGVYKTNGPCNPDLCSQCWRNWHLKVVDHTDGWC